MDKTQIQKQSFTDWKGNLWVIEIDTIIRRRLKREFGFDLMLLTKLPPENWAEMSQAQKNEWTQQNGNNMETALGSIDTDLIDSCLWLCCEERAAHYQMNEVQFFKILNGSEPTPDYSESPRKGEACYAEAVRAWVHALVNFIHATGATGIASILEKNLVSVLGVHNTVNEALESLTQEQVDELVQTRLLASTGTESSNNGVNSVESEITEKIKRDLRSDSSSGGTKQK